MPDDPREISERDGVGTVVVTGFGARAVILGDHDDPDELLAAVEVEIKMMVGAADAELWIETLQAALDDSRELLAKMLLERDA